MGSVSFEGRGDAALPVVMAIIGAQRQKTVPVSRVPHTHTGTLWGNTAGGGWPRDRSRHAPEPQRRNLRVPSPCGGMQAVVSNRTDPICDQGLSRNGAALAGSSPQL